MGKINEDYRAGRYVEIEGRQWWIRAVIYDNDTKEIELKVTYDASKEFADSPDVYVIGLWRDYVQSGDLVELRRGDERHHLRVAFVGERGTPEWIWSDAMPGYMFNRSDGWQLYIQKS